VENNVMHCPSCGAEIEKSDQKYCHECGATLPEQSLLPVTKAHGPGAQLMDLPRGGQPRPAAHELLASVLPHTLQNRLIVGGVTAVVAVFALYVVLGWIIHTLEFVVLPVAVLLAVIYVGFRYLQSRA
jgi:hypothetical protein